MTIVDFERFCEDLDVAVVIPSRKRPEVLVKRTDRLVHGYHLFHAGGGYDQFTYHSIRQYEVPEPILGLAAVRNYILRQLPHRVVVFIDDDVTKLAWVHSTHYVYLDPAQVQLMIMNLVVNADDLGAHVFGISENDIRKSSALVPFRFRAVVGGLIGVIGRDLWFDERNRLKVDYDFCLQSMVKDRLLLKDHRYFLAQDRNTLAGGNMEFRSRDAEQNEIANLVSWWGSDVISSKPKKGTVGLSVNVT